MAKSTGKTIQKTNTFLLLSRSCSELQIAYYSVDREPLRQAPISIQAGKATRIHLDPNAYYFVITSRYWREHIDYRFLLSSNQVLLPLISKTAN